MAHTYYHCGTVSDDDQLGEIPITIHDGKRLNLAIALKRADETDQEWEKIGRKLDKLVHKIYGLAKQPGDKVFYHEPSYIHPEP